MNKKSIFDQPITIYGSAYDSKGTVGTLSEFLFGDFSREDVLRIRSTSEKSEKAYLKRLLPCATISGVFGPTRNSKNLKQHSGFVCLDIDGKDNPDITNWDYLKEQLAAIPQIAFSSLSVSGKGLFLLVPIQYTSCHKGHFLQLEEDFKRMGIVLDHNCSDVSRLRTKSYDANPYVNENALIYNKVKVIERPKLVIYSANVNFGNGNIIEQVACCCDIISSRGIDITSNYENWVKVGFALASLGESGRPFFHVCSSQNVKYNRDETDRKFDNLLKGNGSITIATFFKICKDYGVYIYH